MPGSALQYRIVVWVLRLGLPLLLILGGVVYAAHRGAMRLLEPLHWYGEVVVDEVSFDLGGKVHAKSISYRPFGADEGAAVTARGVDIATPGLRWLVSAGLAGDEASPADKRRAAFHKASRGGPPPEPRALPALGTLNASAESIEFGSTSWLPADLRWIGPATGSPFESLGCGSGRRFDADAFQAMSVPAGPLRGEFRLDASGDRAKVEVRVYAEGRSSTAWSGDLRLKDPTRFFDTDWQDMALAAEQWFVSDETFVVARNRYCARLARVTRQGYVEVHANAIAQELARQGVSVPPELLELFKRFDAKGGELSWHSRPQSPLNRAEFRALPLEEQVRRLGAELSVSGEKPQPFQLVPLSPEEAAAIAATPPAASAAPGAPPQAPAAGPSPPPAPAVPPHPAPAPLAVPPPATAPATTSPVAAGNGKPPAPVPAGASGAPTPAPVPAPPQGGTAPGGAVASGPASTAPPAAAPSAPVTPPKPTETVAKVKPRPLPSYGRIRFDDLEWAIGRVVVVDTRFGTRRVGKVAAFNRAAVTIEINEKGTTLPLTVPRGTVLSVALASPESG